MFKTFIYFLLIIFFLALNISLPKFNGAGPNLMLLLTVAYAFRKDNPDYLWIAFFSGLLLDIYSNVFFGTYTLSFLLIGVGINYATRMFFSADPSLVYFGIVAAIASLMLVGLLYILNSVGIHFQNGLTLLPTIYLKQKIWIDLALNLLLIGPVYYISSFVEKILEDSEKRNASFN